jgi:hypothetical protein
MGLYLGATELSTGGGGGGGGGFTKMKKYATARALNDATDKLTVNVGGNVSAAISGGGQTSFQWKLTQQGAAQAAIASTANALVGYTFNIGYGTQTVTANTGGAYAVQQTVSFTPAVAGGVPYDTPTDMIAPTSFTVNPATDLGLSDGASLGYFMVASGGTSGNGYDGAYGGSILMGTAIITTASTNLVLTPGVSAHSTISGGLTLTTANGSNHYGHRGNSQAALNGGVGINGYGAGCVGWGKDLGQYNPVHGFGKAVSYHATMVASDGAILLFY